MTTKEAINQILRSSWSIIKCIGCLFQNLGKSIDKLVRTYPWICIIFILVVIITFAFAQIGKARAERDKASAISYQLQQQNDSLEIEIVCLEQRLKQ